MSLHSIAELNNLQDPLKQYQFTFIISEMVGSGLSPFNFELQCSAFNLPGNIIKTVDTVVGTHYRRRAALQDKSGTWRTTVYETQGGEIWRALQKWFDLINNPLTGLIATSSQYVRRAEVQILNENLEKAHSFYLYGVFPLRLNQVEIKSSSSDAINLSVDWNYDWFSETKVDEALGSDFSLLKKLPF